MKDRVGPQQEKGIWLTLVDHLQRQDKLPVVAFTLSRNRCDQVSVVPSDFAFFLLARLSDAMSIPDLNLTLEISSLERCCSAIAVAI